MVKLGKIILKDMKWIYAPDMIVHNPWFPGRGDEVSAGSQDGEDCVHRGGQGEGPPGRGQ